MTKLDPEAMAQRAKEIAEKFVARAPIAYAASVKRYAEHYDEMPDEDDFFAWLEGYDWAEHKED